MRPMFYLLDATGRPVPTTFAAWARCADVSQRIVAQEDPIPGVQVSTVFLGVDHGAGEGSPVLWETMMFGGTHDRRYCERYTSRADAEAGHRRAVELVIEGE